MKFENNKKNHKNYQNQDPKIRFLKSKNPTIEIGIS